MTSKQDIENKFNSLRDYASYTSVKREEFTGKVMDSKSECKEDWVDRVFQACHIFESITPPMNNTFGIGWNNGDPPSFQVKKKWREIQKEIEEFAGCCRSSPVQ